MTSLRINFEDIDAIVFDFDGVLTNNLVYVNQEGVESVSCSRADGLAFDVLRKLKVPSYILSTEKNSVVTARANKLKIPVIQGSHNKVKSIRLLADKEQFKLENILYVGNDINDFHTMQLCGYTACPSDSHEEIRSIATFVLNTKGGNGVVRELLESVFNLDFIKILYKE
ncbi:HAD hydrolase family protein [bacterium]|jgi:3-deoxy-D-manno-octulosonate 8-phosphate phosphatase (KDO 8-P phosphatase)|nr:HAD hydrolase family protein [bacterium]